MLPEQAEKYNHLISLQNNYQAALQRVHDNEGKLLLDYQKKIIEEGCFHPQTYKVTEECDNGYGKFWNVEATYCTLCRAILKTDY